MILEDFFKRIADDGRAEGALEQSAQALLSPAGLLYGLGARGARALYDLGLRQREEVPVPVLSVGNITLGGTGKTPFCVWLARHVAGLGRRPAVVSRGYGREGGESRLVVVHDGSRMLATSRDAGDEPFLMAGLLRSVPVVCCSDRATGARHALRRLRADTIILDDGFQHHALARQGDIVLLDATRPLARLSLFPRGTLREPVSGLSRAHLVVLTRWNQAKPRDRQAMARMLARDFPGLAVARASFEPQSVIHLATGEARSLSEFTGHSCIVACGVGHPASVVATAREAGMRPMGVRSIGDHAETTPRMLSGFEKQRRSRGADWLLMTEKDAARLPSRRAFPQSAIAIRIGLRFESTQDEDLAVRTIAARLDAMPVRGLLGRRG